MRIIVVDSDPNLCALVAFALRQCGYSAQEISQSAEALPAVLRERPDAVVIAASATDILALELCRAIRSAGDTPIVLFNAPPQEEHEIAALDLGADVYLSPPLDLRMLCARVRALVRRSAARP